MRLYALLALALLGACAEPERPALFVPDDLSVSLWAESPMFYNPTNIDVDARGRIWVTEAVNYRNFNNDSLHVLHHGQGDRVVILEDPDGDGKAESSKVFVQDKDLVSPLGIAVLGNKVFVSCSPNLIVYTDDNGDDVPDHKEIFLTGFGGKDHDHSLHAVVAGPDGNLYFNTGNAGPHTVTDHSGWTLRSGSVYTGGTPYNLENSGNRRSDDGRVWVGGLALRIGSNGSGLKVLAHNFRNNYELTVDSHGNLWQNDNDDQVIACRTTWLMEGANAGYFSSDGTRYWQADQRPWQSIFAAHWHQDDPGVWPAGDNTGAGSPTGIVRYESDALGEKYAGMLLSAEAGRNVIFSYHPQVSGAGYELGTRSNLISSLAEDNTNYLWNDSAQNAVSSHWFRPSDVAIGTEGAIYVADWYDPVVGGHQMKDSIGYGRIYRITSKSDKLIRPKVDFTTTAGLVGALENPAINVRNYAQQLIVAEGSKAIAPVSALLKSGNSFVRSRAIWTLAAIGGEGTALVRQQLSDANPETRLVSLRALRANQVDLSREIQSLAADGSALVRRELTLLLPELQEAAARTLWLTLAKQYDGKDRWYLEALGVYGETHPGLYDDLLKQFDGANPVEWSDALTGLVWRLHPSAAVDALEQRSTSASLSRETRTQSLTALAFINDRNAVQAMLRLSQSNDSATAAQAKYWLAFRQGNNWSALADWSKTGLNLAHERQVNEMTMRVRMLTDEKQSIYERRWVARSVAQDPIGGQMLMALVADNKLPAGLRETVQSVIFKNPDATVRIQATNYFNQPTDKSTLSIRRISQIHGNGSTGKILFENNCQSCHRVGTTGNTVGPDLSNIAAKFDKAQLLDAIINPSGAVVFGYEAWLLTTESGESLYGFIVADGQTVTIKDLTGKTTSVAANKIVKREKQSGSPMPAAGALHLTEQQLADLVAFLGGKR
ncbi:MAG: c-type cytochrome [Cyclobacteriaceae bacterium]|nr:c-type cytochrome [Cyclobacteriaceae bacterium]